MATIDMGRKLGVVPLWGSLIPSNTMSPEPRPTSVPSGILMHPAVWPQRAWSKIVGCAPFLCGGAGFPCNTMWLGPRRTCVPSFILIHSTVRPQYANVTDRQDRQTTDRQHRVNRFTNGRPKMRVYRCSNTVKGVIQTPFSADISAVIRRLRECNTSTESTRRAQYTRCSSDEIEVILSFQDIDRE